MNSARHPLVMFFAVLLIVGTVAQAQTVTDVNLGGSFTGTIATAGVDTVEARFDAASGTVVRVAVQAAAGSTLEPTIAVRAEGGAALPIDGVQSVAWLPAANTIVYVTAPTAGAYIVTIGGASGNGAFTASLQGAGQSAGGGTTPTLAQLSGTVTNSLTSSPIQGAQVYANSSLVATTGSNGAYSAQLAAGSYSIGVQATGYDAFATSATLAVGTPTVVDAALDPTVAVLLDVEVTGDETPGGSVTATVDVTVPPGATVDTITWTQVGGVPAMLTGAATDTVSVGLGDMTAYKDHLLDVLREPPIAAEDLPPNVPLPEGEFHGGLQDRSQVVGINPFALEEAALVVLEVEVETSAGTATEEVEIHATLPWQWQSGLRNVPRGTPVLLQAKEQASYAWTLSAPAGSLATLNDATTRSPWFTPDVAGLYELDLSDGTLALSSELEVFAGDWRGTIVGQDMDGRPVADTACTFCHNGTNAIDKFTPWMETGHAEIFTDSLNTNTHYGPQCFACHTVGYDPGTDNQGIDEAADYTAFLGAGLINNPGDNWTTVLTQFPETALKGNIQCENCHGPQSSVAHGFGSPLGQPRVDLSSDVCATCHGEPLRHARFQQWQLSGHANYELAIDESGSGSCSRCHTGNGFLAWLPVLLDDDPMTDPLDDVAVTWTADEAHPQTCATCHDPHAEGTTTGVGTNATVRVSGATPPLIAGFQVAEAGRGAICMTCHNSRRGLKNDDVYDTFSVSERSRAPHGSAQTDMLVGQNLFEIDVPAPGGHAALADTCVDCHMTSTPPPALLSYNQGGTNHTFYASETVCQDCHGPRVVAADVQDSVQFLLDQVEDLFVAALIDAFDAQIQAGNTIDFDGTPITDVDTIVAMSLGESRGRQAVTLTLTDGTNLGLTSLANIEVLDGAMMSIDGIFAFTDEALPKAGWNWNMVTNDGSLGVHNPFFASDALTASRDALVQILSGTSRTPRSSATPAAGGLRLNRPELWREGAGRRGR